MTVYSEQAQKFLAHNPTLIGDFGELFGVRVYEHPLHGDEAPLVALYNTNEGWKVKTTYITMDQTVDRQELVEAVADFKRDMVDRNLHWFA